MTVAGVCWLVAVILAGLAAFGVGGTRVQLGWLGVAFVALGLLTTGVSIDT